MSEIMNQYCFFTRYLWVYCVWIRGRWWANDKLAAANVKQRSYFFFLLVDEVAHNIMEGGSEMDWTNHAPSSSPHALHPGVPTIQRLRLLLAVTVACRGTQGPGPVTYWFVPGHSGYFFLTVSLYCFVWVLAAPAEKKVSYKTLISFSLIPFLIKIFFPFT